MRRYKQLSDNRLEHRVIMEEALGFKLSNEFVVHHINGNKKDNRLENLAVMTCKAHSMLHNQKYSLTKKCIVCGKEFLPAPSKRNRAKVCSIECKIKHDKENAAKKNKPINQLSLNGELVKTWASATEIQNTLGYFGSNINKCCKGKINTYKGYIWRYAIGKKLKEIEDEEA